MAATESTIRFSGHTLDKATKAKVRWIPSTTYVSQPTCNLNSKKKKRNQTEHYNSRPRSFSQVTLENYYSNLIAQHIERKQRLAKLEESLKDEGLSEQQKQEKRQQHAQKETEFLRLKRSRLGVEDFEPLKVIGRGAFGEVRRSTSLTFRFFLFLPRWSFIRFFFPRVLWPRLYLIRLTIAPSCSSAWHGIPDTHVLYYSYYCYFLISRFITGEIGTEKGHWSRLRHEDLEKSWYAWKGTGSSREGRERCTRRGWSSVGR